ncbi:MAG TPA: hypothetical protein VGM92_05745, partial [Candidatus Kapabacteria bacterium]
MKRFLLLPSLLLAASAILSPSYAQSSKTDANRHLYYAAKVWGYLKYFHPAVNGCNKNLDSILVALIPEIESDSSDSLFNASLL